MTFDYPKAHEHKNNVMNKMRDGIAGLMKKYKVDVVEGEAKLLPNSRVEINGETHEATDILLCTGSSPAIPPIPGVELDHVVDSTGIIGKGIFAQSFGCGRRRSDRV